MPSPSSIRAGAAYIELYTKDNRFVKGLRAAEAKLKAFGAGITAIGTKFAALGGAIVAPLALATKAFAGMGDHIAKMARRTGFSVEALSELAFVASQGGTDIDTLEKALARMQRTVVDAGRGLATAKDALGLLGLAFEDLDGLSPDQQFALFAERISQIEDPTQRAAAAMLLFGRSGTKLLPMMADGAAGIDKLREKARELGLTMSSEDSLAAEEFTDALDRLWRVVKMGVFRVGAALAPTLQRFVDAATTAAVAVGRWIDENRGLVSTILKVGAAVFAGGVAFLALGAAVSALGSVFGGIAAVITTAGAAIGTLGSLLASLMTPIGLVVGGLGALAAYLVYATGAGGEALAWLGDQFDFLKETALAAWQGIGDALAAGDLALAAKIVWLTLKMEWQRGINFLEAKWLAFKGFFVGVWQGAVFGIARLMTDAWAGLQVAWVETISFLGDAWNGFIGLLQTGWNHFAGFFQKVWARIKGLFTDTNADAEIARINAEVAQQDEAIASKRDAAIVDRERERQRQRAAIERDRIGAQGALNDMQATEQAQREARHQAALAESEKELQAARQEWQDALRTAAAKRAEAESSAPGRLNKPSLDLPTADGLEALMNETRQKIDVVGSFNPLAARGLGADSLSERTAKASEQVAANTKKLVQQAAHGGLVFA